MGCFYPMIKKITFKIENEFILNKIPTITYDFIDQGVVVGGKEVIFTSGATWCGP